MHRHNLLAYLLLLLPSTIAAQPASDLRKALLNPPDNARIMMRWWWFGPSVTKPQLEREMRTMKQGGIGGFEVQPVYPVALDDPEAGFRNYTYLSDEFIDALRFTSIKAKELGLRMDLTLGSGWPFGGPHIPVTQAPGRLRIDRVKIPAGAKQIAVPDIGNGEKLIAAFHGSRQLSQIERGMLQLPAGADGEVRFFLASSTGMQVKRAALGSEGFVIDHYNRAALDNHLKHVGDRLMQTFRGIDKPYAIFSDSLEVFGSDWTPDYLAEFQRRRGYDLRPNLPALIEDIGPTTAAIRYDWGRTLTEIAEDRYLKPLQEYAKRNGTKLRSQTYGTPPVVLSSQALVDLPEGEGHHWRQFSTARWASSASHLYGKPVTSSETFTWLHSPTFRATPLDMKAEADLHFLQGINQLIGHGWPYSPDSAGYPGWRFYAAAVFNDKNPWWIVMPDVAKYLQRASYLLRQGKPANDIAIYLPVSDAYSQFTAGRDSIDRSMDALLGPHVIPQILDAGYNFDFIDDRAIESMGISHPVLILPNLERVPLAAYRKIAAYARNGGVVVATKRAPSAAPGLREGERDTPEVSKLSGELFQSAGARGHIVTSEESLGKQLNAWFPPDLAMPPSRGELGFVHRKLDDGDLYFLVNTSNRGINAPITFRSKEPHAEWWDARTGVVTKASGPPVRVSLAPYESRFIVFSRTSSNAPPLAPPSHEQVALEMNTDWNVSFPAISYSRRMRNLQSWTDDEKTTFYSGQAIYEKTIEVSPEMLRQTLWLSFEGATPAEPLGRRAGPSMRALLDSRVRESALVSINGQSAGSIWCPPYEVNVSKLLKPGPNQIRIVVANTAVNHLAGYPQPNYRLLNLRYGERFTPQDMNQVTALPSGLLGPVRLVTR